MTDQPAKNNGAPSLPWYKEGLRFECTGCGKCCTGPSGYVWINEEEMKSIAASLNMTLELFKRKYVRRKDNRYALIELKKGSQQYDCVFLKDKKCQIYENRPTQCRTYPWWRQSLTSEESWKQASEACEGIHDKAPLLPYEQIEKLVQINESSR